MKPEPEFAIQNGYPDVGDVACTVRDISTFIDAPYSELRIPDSAHWVQNEAVEEVNDALSSFLKSGSLAAN
jgi:hypothetical protein